MPLSAILIIVLIVFLIGAFPRWPYSRSWGYWPSGILGATLIFLLALMLMGRI